MNQTSIIAGSLIVAFFVFITVRGELPYYMAVFTGSSPAPGKATNAGSFSFGSGPTDIGVNVGGVNVGYGSTGRDTGMSPLGSDSLFGVTSGWGNVEGGAGVSQPSRGPMLPY